MSRRQGFEEPTQWSVRPAALKTTIPSSAGSWSDLAPEGSTVIMPKYMKPTVLIAGAWVASVCLLCGCGKSSSPPSEANNNSTPGSSSPTQTAATPPADGGNATQRAAATSISTPDAAKAASAASDSVSQFAQSAAAQSDKVASSIGSDLVAKAKSLAQSAADNSTLKSGVSSALSSLSSGNDSAALTTLFSQAKEASLTPQQTQLVKDVGNLASAYVAQRNFSSLDGAQGDVATLVNSLRKGEVPAALPALQSLAQNASLTPKQKDLLSTLADNYAPGLKKTADSLKQGLQGLQGITK